MKYMVHFIHHKKTDIQSGYRADWVGNHKPKFNCAELEFYQRTAPPNIVCIGILYPLIPKLWSSVIRGDVLKCMEGSECIGEATVKMILEDKDQ
jgi:hypothetical protein